MDTPDITYAVELAAPDDHRYIAETTAKVRKPPEMSWSDWEPYGMTWARANLQTPPIVVKSGGLTLGFLVFIHGAPVKTVEMLYVRNVVRGLGIGRLLLDAAQFDDDVPCRAPTGSWRAWTHRRGIRYTVVE